MGPFRGLSWRVALAALLAAACEGGFERTSPRPEETIPIAAPDSSPGTPAYPVVFSDETGDGREIFALDPPTGDRYRVSFLGVHSEFPVWAPVGERIVFLAATGESADLMILDLVSGETDVAIADYGEMADWGPGAETLLIARDGDDGGLYLFDVATEEEVRVETGSRSDAYARWARQVPMIAYESTRDGNPEIYATRLDSGKTSRLTKNDHLDEWPSPSPDGAWVAWASGTEEDKNLWVMRSDGSQARQITKGLLFGDAFPEWSPDGDRIVLTVNENDRSVLKLIDVASGEVTDLGTGSAPSWRQH